MLGGEPIRTLIVMISAAAARVQGFRPHDSRCAHRGRPSHSLQAAAVCRSMNWVSRTSRAAQCGCAASRLAGGTDAEDIQAWLQNKTES
ncbi:hypothetical protein LC55x_3292 [Lysobacter capsici]|nr:hypothetical protein LC55x_3292 [Lysobacter capsici]